MSTVAPRADRAWVSAVEAAELLGVNPKTIARLADRGLLAVRALPGAWPRYSRESVEALAREYTSGPTDPAA